MMICKKEWPVDLSASWVLGYSTNRRLLTEVVAASYCEASALSQRGSDSCGRVDAAPSESSTDHGCCFVNLNLHKCRWHWTKALRKVQIKSD